MSPRMTDETPATFWAFVQFGYPDTPSGGMGDYVGVFDTEEEAWAAAYEARGGDVRSLVRVEANRPVAQNWGDGKGWQVWKDAIR